MKKEFKYFDISPTLSSGIAVWPGDEEFKRKVSLDFKNGNNLVLSSISTTVHLGAHTDAPSHYHPNGEGISTRPLHYYYGPCQVISVSIPRHQRVQPSDLSNVKIMAHRVLFKTGSFPNPNHWNSDFNSLSAELVHFLAEQGVILIGIDTPSIDLFEDKILESHQAIYQKNMAILEGIVLDAVPEGVYTLAALPLKIENADASPVRAILIE